MSSSSSDHSSVPAVPPVQPQAPSAAPLPDALSRMIRQLKFYQASTTDVKLAMWLRFAELWLVSALTLVKRPQPELTAAVEQDADHPANRLDQ